MFLQVQVALDTARGSVQVTSQSMGNRPFTHLSAYINQVAPSSLAAKSACTQKARQAPESRLGQLLLDADTGSNHTAAVTGLVDCAHAASVPQGCITGMEATLQLASISQTSKAGTVCQWDCAQLQAAPADQQQFAVATPPETVDTQQHMVGCVTWLGKASMQGVVINAVASGSSGDQLLMTHAAASLADSDMPEHVDFDTSIAQDANTVSRNSDLSSIQAQVASAVTRLLGSDSIGVDEPLMAAGLDSLGAAEVVHGLQSAFDISLPATLVFDYPTVASVAAFVVQQIGHDESDDSQQSRAVALPGRALSPAQAESRSGAAALIVGVAGDSDLLQQWTQGDSISRVPHSRWDVSPMTKADAQMPQFGSFLPDVDRFDSTLFGIMASEAMTMDPQQRLLLQTALEAFPSGPGLVRGRAVGAYVGIGTADYNALMQHEQVPFNAFSFTAGSASVASGRLAFAFGLQGPTASIDTACSASLVAAHMACHSFRYSHLMSHALIDAAEVRGIVSQCYQHVVCPSKIDLIVAPSHQIH